MAQLFASPQPPFSVLKWSEMEAFALAAALVLTAQSHLFSPSKADCSECDDLLQLNTKLDALAWKLQDVTSLQHKMKTLERRVQLRDEKARILERRLKATEGDLGAVKVELDRRQREVNGSTRIRSDESETSEHEANNIEEWLKNERKNREVFQLKTQLSIESLVQSQGVTSRKLNHISGKIDDIEKALDSLELEKDFLETTVEKLRTRMDISTNASGDGKPPSRKEQPRLNFNDLLKGAEEVELFKIAANHSDLMRVVANISDKVDALSDDAEKSRQTLLAISNNATIDQYSGNLDEFKNEVLSNFTGVWKEAEVIRKMLEMDGPWEQRWSEEIERMGKTLKLEMDENFRELKNNCLQTVNNSVDLHSVIENITNALQELREDFSRFEEKKNMAEGFKDQFMKHLENKEMSDEMQQVMNSKFIIQDDSSKSSAIEKFTWKTPNSTKTSFSPGNDASRIHIPEELLITRRSSVMANIRKLNSSTAQNVQ